jgi:hypothetical protein
MHPFWLLKEKDHQPAPVQFGITVFIFDSDQKTIASSALDFSFTIAAYG